MSSLRNAVKRITHKERSQPQARAHLGVLEKHKDYRERARDYHKKEDRIKSMRRKASERNPDEFYFGMTKSVVKDGHHVKTQQARQEELQDVIGADAVRIMKDQDLTYVRMQKQRDKKKIERLQASLHYLGQDEEEKEGPKRKKRKHTIFVDTKRDAENFDVAEHFGTVPELAGRAFNRPRVETLRKMATAGHDVDSDEEEAYKLTPRELAIQAKMNRKTAKKVAKARSVAYGEMEARTKRMEKMELAEAHLVTEKLVAGKGRKRKIKGAENGKPAVYKWRRKRLR